MTRPSNDEKIKPVPSRLECTDGNIRKYVHGMYQK
jgi:hypothetical protein